MPRTGTRTRGTQEGATTPRAETRRHSDGSHQQTARRQPPPDPITREDLVPIERTITRTANELAAHDAAVEARISLIEENVLHVAEVVDDLARAVRQQSSRSSPARRSTAGGGRTGGSGRSRGSARTEAKPETLTEAMIAVFGRSRASMTASQILDKLEGREGHRPGGQTPEATISAKLATENAKGGLFERTAPGKYRVRR